MREISDWDPERWLEAAKAQEGSRVRSQENYREAILREFSGDVTGDLLPWSYLHDKFQLRMGEVTCWAGINGHGKSNLLLQSMLYLIPETTVLIASLEMPIPKSARRLLRMASGQEYPSVKFIDQFNDYSFGKLWYYDELDTVDADRIIALTHYAAQELQCKHIVIDSLMKCGLPESGDGARNAEKKFVDTICRTAKNLDVHIHLVVHMRKGQSEEHVPDKFDVMGSSSITNLIDNLVICHRNKRKERELREGKDVDPATYDQSLVVAKQRHGDWEGGLGLYFHGPSQQYVRRQGQAMPWPSAKDAGLRKFYANEV
jgi:twinkle protein